MSQTRSLITSDDDDNNKFFMSVIINCAGDIELARDIRNYMISKISPASDTTYVSVSEDEVEIVVEKMGISRNVVKDLLNAYVKSNSSLSNYSITELDNIFAIGIRKSLNEVVLNCEMCGYVAGSEGDLIVHRRTHGLIFML